MVKELESIKKILEEEYTASLEQLSCKRKLLKEQKDEIKEQERFLQVLEQEREKKTDFLSAYNNDELISNRIEEEKKKKENAEKFVEKAEQEVKVLSEKNEKYKNTLDDLQKVNKADSIIVSGQFMKEMEDLLDQVISEHTKHLKKLENIVEEYIYMDPERVKVEIQTSIKENKSFLRQVKAIRKTNNN